MAISYDDPFSYLELSPSQDCTKAGSTLYCLLQPRSKGLSSPHEGRTETLVTRLLFKSDQNLHRPKLESCSLLTAMTAG